MRIYIKPSIYVVNLGLEDLLDNVIVTNSQGSGNTGQPGGQYAKQDPGWEDEDDDDNQNIYGDIWAK
jgi:hypothetical protein